MTNMVTRARFVERSPSDEDIVVPAPVTGPRVFISHSKTDRLQVERFLVHLDPLREKYGLRVFYEVRALVAGMLWHGRIMGEVARCDVFVLLVSPDSIASRYCIDKELGAALARARESEHRPVIVPVLLRDCSWELLKLPGEPDRKLCDIQALPQDLKFVLGDSGQRADERWTEIVRGLARTLEELVLPIAPLRRGAADDKAQPRREPIPALLPYLCDQSAAEDGVETALDMWRKLSGEALVVLLRARPDDCPDKFVERVLARRIGPLYLQLPGRRPYKRHTGLKWPGPEAHGWSAEQFESYFLKQLKAKFLDDRTSSDEALAAAICNTKCHHVLLSELPRLPAAQLDDLLMHFAKVLCTLGSRCGTLRLVALVWSLDDEVRTHPRFKDRVERRPLAIPSPMSRFAVSDAREWARLDEVQQVATLDDSDINAAFGDSADDISMMQFARTVGDLLSRHRPRIEFEEH